MSARRHTRRSPAGGRSALRHFLQSPLHWLLVMIPLAIVLDHAEGVPAPIVFTTAGLAILPLASIVISATEQIALRVGDAVGGLLNATFGNAPELIIAMVALRAGQLDLVKASIAGGIVGNLLFALGLAFFVGGLQHHTQQYNPRGARIDSSMLMLAAISLIVPSLFHNYMTVETVRLDNNLSVTVAIVLLLTYAMSLLYMLRTHSEDFGTGSKGEEHDDGPRWNVPLALLVLIGSSVVLAVTSEILVGSVEVTAKSLGMSRAFIGVILLALLGGAPESMAAVAMARRNKMDLAFNVAVGSSMQIALFVAPTLVLASYVLAPQRLDLVMGNAGSTLIFLAVLVTAMVAGQGQSNWFKGALLLGVYALLALFCYFIPDALGSVGGAP